MVRLRSRELQIPGGFKFLQPETGFKTRPFASFTSIVNAVCIHRRGNPTLLAKGLSDDPNVVAQEVEAFNVKLCLAMGWNNYLSSDDGGAALPKSPALSQKAQSEVAAAAGHVRKIWAGVKTINEWLDSGDPGVDRAKAEARAAVCAACPRNEPGDWTRWFTAPASEAIKRQIEKAAGRNLKTSVDEKLNTCGVCLCPLKLSVHVPLEIKLAHLSPEVEAELRQVRPKCWVCTEKDAG